MDLSEVILAVRKVREETGKKVGITLLKRSGYEDVASWIVSRYPSFTDFAQRNGLDSICKTSVAWTDELAISVLEEMHAKHNGFFYDTDIRKEHRLLWEYIYKRSGSKHLAWFLDTYNIDYVKVKFANREGTHFQRSTQRVKKWTKDYVVHMLSLMWATGHRLDTWYLQTHGYGHLLSHACKQFYTYENACAAAGFDYERDIMRVKRRGREWVLDELQYRYKHNWRFDQDSMREDGVMSVLYYYFRTYPEAFREADVPVPDYYTSVPWFEFGDRFESIVKRIFDELYPMFLYQFKYMADDIIPDWFDPETYIIYDAKLSKNTIDMWDKLDTYLANCNHLVIVYLRESDYESSSEKISLINVQSYLPLLSDDTRTKVELMLDDLKSEMKVIYTDN